ncbi:MAG: 16S rRNA (cytosine(1402)-N(4))-methyltransferase RsmH [Deltaproteobacteria bacterium]|nr:16S rRNA (cytosine(1402)-N(4))-methyltransferase RsmH [Deltaproteobacteria bacterium]
MSEDQVRPSPGGGGVDAEAEVGRRHAPVMVEEAVRFLHLKPGGFYVDGTLGDGGHAQRMLEADASVAVLGVDRDAVTLELTARRLAGFGSRFRTFHGNFSELDRALAAVSRSGADGILLDLGISSRQLDDPARGFGFRAAGPLDMRMHGGAGASAADLVATLDERELADIFWRYGEEKASRRIARAIVQDRASAPFTTTSALADLVARIVRRHGGTHPATRVFQALRIAVNRELEHLEIFLERVLDWLLPAGRLVVIAYHSLEDRMVKQAMRSWLARCTCPPTLPRCACGARARVTILTKKAVAPRPEEIAVNRRARSARLRAVELVA